MSLLSADTPASERRAPLPLEADTFWYGVGSATSQPPSSGLSLGEWAHLTAAMILLGVSLTSLILALTAGFGGEDRRGEIGGVLSRGVEAWAKPPGALLIVGLEQEALWMEGGVVWPEKGQPPPRALLSGGSTPKIPLSVDGLSSYWVLGREDVMPEHPAQGYVRGEVIEEGAWRLERWEIKNRSKRGVDLLAMLPMASAEYRPIEGEDAAKSEGGYACEGRWFGRRRCGPNEWNWFGVEELVVRGERVSCVWAHPLQGHEFVIRFPALDLGGDVRGRFALSDHVAENPEGGQVTMRVEVGGEEKVKKVVANKRGWQPFSVPGSRGEGVELTFIISATHDGQRHFCFQADAPAIQANAREAAVE